MAVNYYNNINIINSKEQPISLFRQMDRLGACLIKPYRGHSYSVDLVSKEIKIEEINTIQSKELSIGAKIKVSVGIAFKKVASFFNKDIKAKYSLVSNNNYEKVRLEAPIQKRKVIKLEGAPPLPLCCICCIL